MAKEREELENITEENFKKWLDSKNVPYWYVRQDMATFSPALRKYMVKRPDYMILMPHFGFLIVEVKHARIKEKYPQFDLPADDVRKHSNLQRLSGLHVWYAVSCQEIHFTTWYWIPVTTVLTCKQFEKAGIYYAVPLNYCVQLSRDDSLDRLFTMIFKKE